MLNYFIPENQNYIILESLNSIKENQYPLSVHVLMFIDDNDSFILGWGHESDVRISDISVSRTHARIYMKNNKFMLEDNESKFGTLVLAKEAVIIDKLDNQILQIGRTLINLSQIKDKKNLFEENGLKNIPCLENNLNDEIGEGFLISKFNNSSNFPSDSNMDSQKEKDFNNELDKDF